MHHYWRMRRENKMCNVNVVDEKKLKDQVKRLLLQLLLRYKILVKSNLRHERLIHQ